MNDLLGCFTVVLPLIAIITAIVTWRRTERLQKKIDSLEARLWAMPPQRREPGVSGPLPTPPAEKASSPVEPTSVSPPLKPISALTPERDAKRMQALGNLLSAGQTTLEPGAEGIAEKAPAEPTPAAPPPPRPRTTSLEETLGTRMTVWIGAVALALAGAYLVKYTFDRNLLTPPVRIIIGMLFGGCMLGVGEFLRARSHRVAEGVTAAGVADLFACLLAATNLYHLLSPLTGFSGMAIVTALAVVLSLRQGPFVAGLGLIGGFLTPVLIQTGETNPSLFVYLFFLEAGLLAVTRRRGWGHLAVLTLLGAMGWAGFWTIFLFHPDHSVWIGGFLLASTAAFVAATRLGKAEEVWGDKTTGLTLTWTSTAMGLALTGYLVHAAHFGPMEWGFLGLLGAGCLILARIDPELHGFAWLAAAITWAMLAEWGYALPDAQRDAFKLTMLLLGTLYAAGSYVALWRSLKPSFWAGLSGLAGVAWFILAYATLYQRGMLMTWAQISGAFAAVYALAAAPLQLQRQRKQSEIYADALGVMVAAVTVFVSLAVPMALKREWIAVAWAVEIPLLALVERWLRISTPRLLIWPLFVLVVGRLFMNPEVFRYPISSQVVFNWLSYGYGIPIVAFWSAGVLLRRKADDRLVSTLEHTAWVIGAALLTLQIRQYFHPQQFVTTTVVTLAEWGVVSVAWISYGWLLLWAHRTWRRLAFHNVGWSMVGVACIQILVCQLGSANPLWMHSSVGSTAVFNSLLLVYGAPAILVVACALDLRKRGTQEALGASGLGVLALLLFFTLISLEIRQYFQGEFLDGHGTGSAERYAYSVAWVLYGTLLLILGIMTRGTVLRYASLVMMLLSAGKVFLFDTAHLQDLYRVFSFLGLGISLLLLGYLYQRFVFSDRKQNSSTDATPARPE